MSRILPTCDGCGVTVSGSEHAAIHVLLTDALQHERQTQRWQVEHGHGPVSLTVLLTAPELAHWAVHCDDCNPHPSPDNPGVWCDGCYWISLDRCQTEADLLRWTAHLMGKTWLAATDWPDLLRRLIGDHGPG